MVNAIIVYGTRYGATEDTSEVIAETLRKEGYDVKVVNAKDDKIMSIKDYELIIVGSGIRMGRWTKEAEKFLERFQQELSNKKLALFVCCGSAYPLEEGEEKIREMEDARINIWKRKLLNIV